MYFFFSKKSQKNFMIQKRIRIFVKNKITNEYNYKERV